MAKGAANENALGGLHSLLAQVFERTLQKYLKQLEAIENIDPQKLEGELVVALLEEVGEPNPAMLSALSKFLKDNDIRMDSEEVDKLNNTERQLRDARERRKSAGVNLAVVPHVAEV